MTKAEEILSKYDSYHIAENTEKERVVISYESALAALNKALTAPDVVENKELPVYKVVFNEGTDDGVTSINLTKTPLFNAKQTGEHLRSSCDWCNPPQRK
jgi:dethiobiotin synthetase